MGNQIDIIRAEIAAHPSNREYEERGWKPLFEASEKSRVVIIGHAPGRSAQEARLAWGDASGQKLMRWLGVSEETFRDTDAFALLPMDFYYQGKGKSGDLPPRKAFAPLWHPRFFALMPDIRLTILIGAYSQGYYLGKRRGRNLTETVKAYADYLPEYFPLVHPSPLNFRWQAKNPWFEQEVIPSLQRQVALALETGRKGAS